MSSYQSLHFNRTGDIIKYGYLADFDKCALHLIGDDNDIDRIFLRKVFCSPLVYASYKESMKHPEVLSIKNGPISVEEDAGQTTILEKMKDSIISSVGISKDSILLGVYIPQSVSIIRMMESLPVNMSQYFKLIRQVIRQIEELSIDEKDFAAYLHDLAYDYATAPFVQSNSELHAIYKSLQIYEYEKTLGMKLTYQKQKPEGAWNLTSIREYLTEEEIMSYMEDVFGVSFDSDEEDEEDYSAPVQVVDRRDVECEVINLSQPKGQETQDELRYATLDEIAHQKDEWEADDEDIQQEASSEQPEQDTYEEDRTRLKEQLFVGGCVAAYIDGTRSYLNLQYILDKFAVEYEDIDEEMCKHAHYVHVIKDKNALVAKARMNFRSTGCESMIKL